MIFFNNKKLLITLLMFASVSAFAHDTHYYKLTKKVVSGVTYTKVSGGQFITFISDVCYESDKNGVGVDNGKLTKNSNYSNSQYSVYQGTCYYGSNAEFKFNSDKSMLNIITEKGDIYVYKRTTPPKGVTTCSLIKSKQKKSGSPNGSVNHPVITPVPTYSGTQTSPLPSPSPSPSPKKTWKTVTYQEMCPLCFGTGNCQTCLGKGWYYNPLGTGTLVCPNCDHNHNGKCSRCHGTGKVTKTKQVYE